MLSLRSDVSDARPNARPPSRPWREVELVLLVLLVLGAYFTRLATLTIRGEEPRWARVAQEMIDSGDYVVPRQQGQPFPDRPPLNSWAMIAASTLTGELNLVAIRLPSALATLLTTLLIYIYGRNYLSRTGALAAAAAYATMGIVLALGRVAESDALLTLCLTAALFAWHYGYDRRHDPRLAWLCGYSLAALAALAKGPQGPIYFLATTVVLLSVRRDWQFLCCRWHVAGLGLFAAIIASWQVPFLLSLEPADAARVWTEGGNLASRFQSIDLARAMRHWTSFPVEVLGAMAPWSFMLPVLATRWFRQNLGAARPLVGLVVIAWAVAFPTCWLPVESRPRHLMCLCPCAALLVGLVIQRSWEAQQIGWWRRSWDNFLLTGVGLVVGAPVLLGWFYVFGEARVHGLGDAVSARFLLVYGVIAGAAVAAALWSRSRQHLWRAGAGVMALTGFLGLSYNTIVLDMQVRTSNDPSDAVASIRDMIPPGQRLVSFGHVHHLFAYYYAQPVGFEPLDGDVAPADSAATYFCFTEDPGFVTPTIPFAWERVAEISCERARSERPLAKVIVGRRVPLIATASPEPGDSPDDKSPDDPSADGGNAIR